MEKESILDYIDNEIPVIGSSGDQIGEVEYIQYGQGGADVELPHIKSIIEDLGVALRGQPDYPDEVYERLYSEGFIRIERGMSPDAFALTSQIANVKDGKVYLNTDIGELLEK